MTAPRTGAPTSGAPAQWSVAEVAAYLGVKPRTVTSYLTRGQIREPDGYVGRTPWWWETTITAWQQQRPGRGARTTTKEHIMSTTTTETTAHITVGAHAAARALALSWLHDHPAQIASARQGKIPSVSGRWAWDRAFGIGVGLRRDRPCQCKAPERCTEAADLAQGATWVDVAALVPLAVARAVALDEVWGFKTVTAENRAAYHAALDRWEAAKEAFLAAGPQPAQDTDYVR